MSAPEGHCADGVHGHAGSTCPGDDKCAAKTAGARAEVPPPSKQRRDREAGRKSSGSSKAAAGSAPSGGEQRPRASGGSAAAAAAAQRELTRLARRTVEDLCLEADEFSVKYEDVDAEEILAAVRGYDSDIMAELLELQERLNDALNGLPGITSRMEDMIGDRLNMLDDMVIVD